MTQDVYQKAMKFAGEKHATQQVPGINANYLLHISNVAMEVLMAFQADPNFDLDFAIQVAILHDTIEDTLLTKKMISQIFNESIASKVEDLTRIKVNKKIPAGETLELVYPQNKKDILYIKLFDRLHNMRTIAFLSEIKRNKVIDETVEYFVSLCSVLDLYEVKKELITLSYQYKSLHNYPIFAANDTSLPDSFSFLPSILTK